MFKRLLLIILALAAVLFSTSACSSPVSQDTEIDDSENTPAVKDAVLPNGSLQKGDENEAVQHLQTILQKIDYEIEATGKFDEITTWAITDLQLQKDDLHATGVYDSKTKKTIEKVLEEQTEISPGTGLKKPTEEISEEGTNIVANPYDILSLVNKENALPEGYIPEDLVSADVRFPFTEDLPKKQMRQVAADALAEMFDAGDKAGIDLFAQSGYRSYGRQDAIFASYSEEHGVKAANNFSARPGESEHQTGLTMDVTSPDIEYDLNTDFGETNEGKWIKENAAEFGFIIRYPEGKEDITKYQYEPWHLRYVGKKAAKKIAENGLTLEEYIEQIMK